MSKSRKFVVPSLLAAGLVPLGASAGEDSADAKAGAVSLLEGIEGLISGIEESHHYTLAAHSSHASHASHGSHGSHRSSSMRMEAPSSDMALAALEGGSSRNVSSTPANSVLPSSPAIARKLKVLPGNSKKFAELVTRLQIALLSRGYEVGAVDGSLHARTVAALYRYQGDQNMVPTGKVTPETLSMLGISAQ